MTGYGRGEYEDEFYRFIIEIKSVNHRYSDITIKMPRHISYLEDTIKRTIKEKINRGKVDVYINLEYVNESAIEVMVDIPLARAYKEALEDLKLELNLEDKIRLNNILVMNEVIKTTDLQVGNAECLSFIKKIQTHPNFNGWVNENFIKAFIVETQEILKNKK